jgi:hypothetical protein
MSRTFAFWYGRWRLGRAFDGWDVNTRERTIVLDRKKVKYSENKEYS